MAALYNTNCCAHPAADLLLKLFVRPVTNYNLALNAHTCYHMAKLSVTMCGLVLIHEIHIDCVIWNFHVKLSMKMKQWLSVLLKTKNPRLCRRECVHPNDYTCTLIIDICLVKSTTNQLVCNQCWLPNNLEWKISRLI